MKSLRIAVVGCGDIAKSMLWIFKLTKGIKVTALCDLNEERLKKAGRIFGKADTYTDYADMFEKADADAVYLAVPHFLHYPMMKKALENKLHIFCEKPITIETGHAEEIIKLADHEGLVVAVNYQYRYDSSCYRLVRAVRNNDLGKIHFIRCIVPWSRDDKYFRDAPWHASIEKAGGGTLITQGSHLLDIILWMNGCNVKAASGVCKKLKFTEVEVEDYCFAELELENGVAVQFLSTMAAPVEGKIRLEVYGEHGYGEYIKKGPSSVSFAGTRPPKYQIGKPALHAVQRSVRDFRDAVMGSGSHLCQGGEAIEVLKAVNYIYDKTRGE